VEVEEDHVGLSYLHFAKRERAAGRRRDLITVLAQGVLQNADGVSSSSTMRIRLDIRATLAASE
jgi:hypothetical protein